MTATATEILESVVAKAKAAIEGASKEGDDKDKAKDKDKMPPFMRGKSLKAIAEKFGKLLEKVDGEPDAGTVFKLRGMINQMSAAIERNEHGKLGKSIDMSIDKFSEHVGSEIEAFTKGQDLDRLAMLESNVESVAEQLTCGEQVETVKVTVSNDPAQVQTTQTEQKPASSTSGAASMGAFAKAIEGFTTAVEQFKAKAMPEGEDDEDSKNKGKDKGDKADAKDAKTDKGDGKDGDDKGDGVDGNKQDTKKSDVEWPLDLNKGRDLSESEQWGRTKKSVSGDDRDFGADPSF